MMFQFFLLWGINLLATQFNRQAQKRRTTRKFKAPIHMALKMRPTGLSPGVYKENVVEMKEAARACPGAARTTTGNFGIRWPEAQVQEPTPSRN